MTPLHRKDPGEQAFLEEMLAHCREVGVSVRTAPRRQLWKRQVCTGIYHAESKSIWLARKHPLWWEVLIHEYCHLLQDLDGRDHAWFMSRSHDWKWQAFDDWVLHRRELRADRLLSATRVIQAMELDCDKRVVKILRKHDFPTIDIATYSMRSNAYAWSYEAARLTRKWTNKERPYRVPEIRALVPAQLIREDQLSELPEGYLELFIRKCVYP